MQIDKKIKFGFTPTNCYTRYPCHVCGGRTEKVNVLCEVMEDAEWAGTRICESCLKRGDVDAILEESVEGLEREAKNLRSLIGNVVVPTYEEWERAEREDEAKRASEQRKEEKAEKKRRLKIEKVKSKLERAQWKLEKLQPPRSSTDFDDDIPF